MTTPIQTEHQGILGALRAVETMLEAESPATGDLQHRLDALGDLLEAHFERERLSPLFESPPPEHRDLIERLESEHRPFLEEIRLLTSDTGHASDMKLSSDLSIRIRMATAKLREHEAAESALYNQMSTGERATP